jgi:hypothetical protein
MFIALAVIATYSNEPLFPAEVGNKSGYIDRSGKVVIPARYWSGDPFSEGRAVVYQRSANNVISAGVIDSSGKLLVPFRSQEGYQPIRYKEGLLTFQSKGGYGYLDRQGKWAIRPRFRFSPLGKGDCGCAHEGMPISDFSEGFAFVQDRHRHYYIDKRGRRAFNRDFQRGGPFRDGFAAVGVGHKHGLIDRTGKFVIPPRYSSAGEYADGLWPVSTGKLWRFVDKSNRTVIPGPFTFVYSFSEGLAVVERDHNTRLVIDRSGKTVFLLPKDVEAYAFKGGLLKGLLHTEEREEGHNFSASWSNDQVVFFDRRGKMVISLPGSDIRKNLFGWQANDFENGLAKVWTQDGRGSSGYIDATGRWIWKRNQ